MKDEIPFNDTPTVSTRDIKLASALHVLGFAPVDEGLAVNVERDGECYSIFRFKDSAEIRELVAAWLDREKWQIFKQENPRHLLVLFRSILSSNNETDPLVVEICDQIEAAEDRAAYCLALFIMREWIKNATKRTGTARFQRSKTDSRKWRFQTIPGENK